MAPGNAMGDPVEDWERGGFSFGAFLAEVVGLVGWKSNLTLTLLGMQTTFGGM